MATLRDKVEHLMDKQFEIAMCLYYPDGNYFAAYHFDQQTSGDQTILPSMQNTPQTWCSSWLYTNDER